MTPLKGVFASEYSAMTQRAIMAVPYGRAEYVGQLRLDLLLAGRIVVPDSQLLDGRFFLETGPEALRQQLGLDSSQALPLRIKPRRATLKRTLSVWLERPGSEYLNGFPFNAIRSDDVRAALAVALTETKATELRRRLNGDPHIPQALAAFLRDLLSARGLQADDDIDVMERGWSLWLEEENGGNLAVEEWDGPFDLRSAMALDPIDVDEDLLSGRGRELHQRLSTFAFRSDATALIRETKEDASTDELLDVETLSSWYTDARHRAFAMQHRCAFARAEKLDGVPVGPVRRALMRTVAGDVDAAPSTFYLAPRLIDDLVSMRGEQFGELITSAREPLLKWWRTNEPSDLERLVAALGTRLSYATTSSADGTAMAQLLAKVAAGAVGLTVGAAAGPTWAVVAALMSDGLLAAREQYKESKTRAVRTRVVEYGLDRIGSSLK